MMESVPPTVILLIATFCAIIIISGIILFLAMNKDMNPPSSQEESFAEDLQMCEEHYGLEGREMFTFVYDSRRGGYGVVGVDGEVGVDGQEFGGDKGKGSESDSRKDLILPKLSLRSWLGGLKRGHGKKKSGSHTRGYSRNGSRDIYSGWGEDDGSEEGTIRISPSYPAMFGTLSSSWSKEEGGGGGQGEGREGMPLMKVMLTPPTPAKERVYRAVLVSDSRDTL